MLCEHGNVHPCFDCDVAPADQEIQSLRRMLEQAQARVAELERVRDIAEQIRYIAIESPASNNMQLIYRLACQQAEKAGGEQ